MAEVAPSGLYHAVLWQNGTMRDLGTLPGYDAESSARRVNKSGQAVGYSFSGAFGGFRATLWANGVPSDLGALAGDYTSLAYDINAKGHVVGFSHNYDEEEPFHAFLYINGTMRDLGISSQAHGINAYDQVVGQSSSHASLWEGGRMDLGTPRHGW
jgi:probable HAF family extracellular repeat protein